MDRHAEPSAAPRSDPWMVPQQMLSRKRLRNEQQHQAEQASSRPEEPQPHVKSLLQRQIELETLSLEQTVNKCVGQADWVAGGAACDVM